MRLYRAHAFPLAAILLPLCHLSAQVQPTRSEPQIPLQIVHPIETVADLQRELDRLEAQSTNVDGLLAENAKNIYGGASQALNSTAEALLGPIFGRPADYQGIQKNLTQAATAAQGSKDALTQAEAALQSGQTSLALTKTAEAVALAREAQTKSKVAFEQTAAIFKRTNSVLTGEMSPAQLMELAQRYWESRPDLSTAAKGLLTYLNANEEQPPLIRLKHELNAEITQLTNLKIKQAFAPQAPLPETSTLHLPVVQPPPNSPPLGTHANAPATVTPQRTESTLKTSPNGVTSYDPSSLTPAEQAARNANQQIVASETLGTGKIPSAQPNEPELIDLLNCSEAGTKNYYTTTTGQNCGDFLKGQASRSNKTPSTLKTSSNGVTTYDPSALTPAEQAARNANQQIIASETLNKTPSTLKTSSNGVTTYDPSALTPAEQAARNANQQIVANETLNKPPSTLKTSPNGVTTYDPSTLSPSEQAARQRNEAIVAREIVSSVSSNFGYPSYSRQSTDGRLTATMQWSFKNAEGPWPQAMGSWAVYDQGQYVGTYNSDVVLSNNGKFQVLVTPGASALLTTDGKPLAPVYATVDAGLQIQSRLQDHQFSQQNKDTLSTAGYISTKAFGGDIFAGAKGNGWDLLDSNGNKINDGGYTQTKSLDGGAVAATKNPTGTNWDVFGPNGNQIGSGYQQVKAIGNGAFAVSNDPLGYVPARWTVLDLSGHQIGNGPYTYVAASGNRIAVEKLGDHSFSYLNAPAITHQAQPARQAAAAVAPKPTVATTPMQTRSIQQSTNPTSVPATGGQQQYGTAKGTDTQAQTQGAINSQLSKSSMNQATSPPILKTSSLKPDQPVKEQALNAAQKGIGVEPALKSLQGAKILTGSSSTALVSKAAEVATVKPTPALPVNAHVPSPVYAPPPMPRMERLQVYVTPPVYVPLPTRRMERLQVYAPPSAYVPPLTLRVEPVQTIYVAPLQHIEPRSTVKSSVPSLTYSAPAYSATVHTAPPPPPVHHK